MKKHLLIVVLQLAAAGNDAYWTNHNQHFSSHYETNPLSRQFVKTTGGCVAYFSATTAFHLALPWALRKHHHNKLARIAELEGIADNAEGGIYSALHAQR